MSRPITIPQLVLAQASGTGAPDPTEPDGAHIALRDHERRVTYRELCASASAVARRLLADGPGAAAEPPPVVVIAPLGIDGFILQLGALWAGRVVVPLAADTPVPDLLAVIARVGGTVISSGDHSPLLEDLTDLADLDDPDHRDHRDHRDPAAMIDLTEVLRASGDGPIEPPQPVDPHGPALVCFTSGSTGIPKGVLVSHDRMIEGARFAGTVIDDVVAVTSPPSYFASMLQTLTALAVGATAIHLDLTTSTPTELREVALRVGLSHLTGTSTHVRELARVCLDQPLAGLRAIDLGGEPTTHADLLMFGRAFPNARIRNIYGNTELGRVASFDHRPGDPLPTQDPIPAGRSSSDTAIVLLDPAGGAIADSTEGRVAVPDRGQFLGYWQDPEANAAVRAELTDGRRALLTDDLGRIDDDGNLVITSRVDDRVKIHGRFVNLRDIDRTLVDSGLATAAHTYASPADAPTELITVIVPTEPGTDDRALRAALMATLTTTVLPRSIHIVDALPITAVGKVDTVAVRRIHRVGPREIDLPPDVAHTYPEHFIRTLVGTILERDDVRLDDEFFSVGGDSRGVFELLAGIADGLGVELQPSDILLRPTLRELAAIASLPVPDPPHERLRYLTRGEHDPSFLWTMTGSGKNSPVPLALMLRPHSSLVCLPPGAQRPERPGRSIRAIAHGFADGIIATVGSPIIMIGFSGGALFAHATAVELMRRGRPADLLVLLDPPRRTPSDAEADRKPRFPTTRAPFGEFRAIWANRGFWSEPRTAEGIDLRLFRRHTVLARRHVPAPYGGRSVVVLSEEFAEGDPGPVEKSLTNVTPPIVVPGTHASMLTPGGIGAVTAILRPLADELHGRSATSG